MALHDLIVTVCAPGFAQLLLKGKLADYSQQLDRLARERSISNLHAVVALRL